MIKVMLQHNGEH